MPRVAQPYRTGYKLEVCYSTKSGLIPPSHGCGPRCRVDYNPNDDGPWTTLRIMDVRHDKEEDYTCALPRFYAVPLILINKTLAYVEAQCRPDGTPLSSSHKIRLRDLRDYSYLWRLRQSFLKAIYDMNHDSQLNVRWRFEKIHGFLYRMYRRFGHDPAQRLQYFREEIEQGRKAYTEPDVAEMDWETYLLEDVSTSTRINAFLWNRISQGYSRVVKDAPPFEGWRRWRSGHRDHEPMAYATPAPSPVRELPGELGDVAAAAAGRAQDGCEVRRVARPAAAVASSSSGNAAARCGVLGVNNNNEEEDGTVVLTATLADTPSRLQEWDLPLPLPTSEQLSSPPEASQATSTSSQGHFRTWPVDFKLNTPFNDMTLTTVQCTFNRIEDVKPEDSKTTLKVVYASKPS